MFEFIGFIFSVLFALYVTFAGGMIILFGGLDLSALFDYKYNKIQGVLASLVIVGCICGLWYTIWLHSPFEIVAK